MVTGSDQVYAESGLTVRWFSEEERHVEAP